MNIFRYFLKAFSNLAMSTLFAQGRKILRQLFGKENIFGYKTTLANQLFLLYCFCGKIYFTDKINYSFRIIWILYHLSGLFVGYVVAIAFLLNDKEPDFSMQLFMVNMIANSTLMGFFIPFISFWYRDSIEQSIRNIDFIILRVNADHKLDMWTYVLRNIVIEIISGAIFAYICVFDVIVFYEEEKVKNYTYYLFPFPNTEQVGTFRMFLVSTALSCIILSSQSIEALSALAFILIWNVVCHSQMKIIGQKLDYRSTMLSSHVEKNYQNRDGLSESIRKAFKQSVVQGVRDFQRITSLIESLRRFYQLFCSSAVPVTIIGVIVQLHSIVSTNLPEVVKIKGIGMMAAVAYPLLLFCWIGETLENSVSQVSFSVYSMPWYWNTSFRQDTHLFLCQTQHDLKFTAIRVYPMLLRTFSRFSHFVSSSVNFLHQLSR